MEIVMSPLEEEPQMVMQNGRLDSEVLQLTLWPRVTKKDNFTQQHGAMPTPTLQNLFTIRDKTLHI